MPKVRHQVTRGCTFCNTCIFECPVGAITMTQQGALIAQDKCTGCGACYNNCAFEAIEKIVVQAKLSRGD